MWKEIESNFMERIDNKALVFLENGIGLIDYDNGKVVTSPFTDLPELLCGMAGNIRKGERFSTIHEGKLYFIAGFQEEYDRGSAVAFMDIESGEYGLAFYMDEWISKMELSNLALDQDGAYFCVGTVKRGDGYTQCILCPEPGFIWGISKHTKELEKLEKVDDLADDIRIVMGDISDGNIHFTMGSAAEPESEYKRYVGFVDMVTEESR